MVGYHQSAQAQHFQHELDDDDEEFYHRHQQHQLQQQQQQQQQRLQQRISPQRSRAHYNRLQYRRMYRYGLSLLLVGALCNWIGFAQHYFAPVRYLGVGCVIAGALCICIALCRWLTIRGNDESTSATQEISSFGTAAATPSIHVIAVPMQGGIGGDPFRSHQHPSIIGKPPDYDTAIGSKPPSYDEAIRITPTVFLQQQQQQMPNMPLPGIEVADPNAVLPPAAYPATVSGNPTRPSQPNCTSIDCCVRCGGTSAVP